MAGKLVIAALALVVATSTQTPTEKNSHFSIIPPDADPNDFSCDPAGQIFLLLPHFTDCNKFFMCAHGNEVEFSCSAPILIFDFHNQVCNWPAAATCTLRTPLDEGSGDEVNDDMIGRFLDPVEQQAVDSVASVRPLAAAGASFNGILNCNRADDAAKQVAYSGDCQRYWRCVGGSSQIAYCSDGLFFNEVTQQCDFEGNSKCDPSTAVDELQSEFIVYK